MSVSSSVWLCEETKQHFQFINNSLHSKLATCKNDDAENDGFEPTSITKGNVMDKVKRVFSSISQPTPKNSSLVLSKSISAKAKLFDMGNSNQSKHTSNAAGEKEVFTKSSKRIKEEFNYGTDIPKGAVSNGRAKFEEAVSSDIQTTQKPSLTGPFKHIFGSSIAKARGKVNSPNLPLKVPKIVQKSTEENDKFKKLESLSEKEKQNKKKSNLSYYHQIKNEKRFISIDELWFDDTFLFKFFHHCQPSDRLNLSCVCKVWRNVLYQSQFWHCIQPIIPYRQFRNWSSDKSDVPNKINFFSSLKIRGFDCITLFNSCDADVIEFMQNFPEASKQIQCLKLENSSISDRCMALLLEFLEGLIELSIVGCNELSDQGLWSSLIPRITTLTIKDCINVADECICAVTQLLPFLSEFNLQAYHVTDFALSYFNAKHTPLMKVLRLLSCWEITNHGIINIAHTLPNLTVLSVCGCSKISDDGIELISENLRNLTSLDISWCPRISDCALDYIANELNNIKILKLDRCINITDTGIGYVSTMTELRKLYLRWCIQLTDISVQHICEIKKLLTLSLAGCSLITSESLTNLIQLVELQELELTNCAGTSKVLVDYLTMYLTKTLIFD